MGDYLGRQTARGGGDRGEGWLLGDSTLQVSLYTGGPGGGASTGGVSGTPAALGRGRGEGTGNLNPRRGDMKYSAALPREKRSWTEVDNMRVGAKLMTGRHFQTSD